MKIHGLEANVLLDSGYTSDSMSPEFTVSANLKVHKLEEPIPLQLGMVGSRSKINFGLFSEFELQGIQGEHYFNVVNLNRYDVIIRTVFMRKHGIILDFECDEVHLKGKVVPTIIKCESTFGRDQGPLERKDIPHLRKEWIAACEDILQGPKRPPPMREINHQIPLMDEGKQYNYHLPCCLDLMRQPLAEKINKYCPAGWWQLVQAEQAAPMLVVPKKNGAIQTVVNTKRWNDNTVKNVTPFPDQDLIHGTSLIETKDRSQPVSAS
ncbi:hypothetical protein L208DRAFT_1324353 [Tricholoma matsutake]|nr:hypothetical protein L208DRAFT_1324353 [Tricholoma matsutake 945]